MLSVLHWQRSLKSPVGRILVIALSSSSALLAALATAYGLADSISAFLEIEEQLVKAITFRSIAVMAVLSAALVLAICLYVPAQTALAYIQDRRHLHCVSCNYADLQAVSALAEEAFSGEASDLAVIQRLWSIDKKCFWKVCRAENGGRLGDAIGYFCVLRVSAQGAQSLEEGTFVGASPPTNHLNTSSRRRCRHAYIGALYGRNAFAKGIALAALTAYLDLLRSDKIYARGFSPAGIRLLEKNGFRLMSHPTAAQKGFYVRERN